MVTTSAPPKPKPAAIGAAGCAGGTEAMDDVIELVFGQEPLESLFE